MHTFANRPICPASQSRLLLRSIEPSNLLLFDSYMCKLCFYLCSYGKGKGALWSLFQNLFRFSSMNQLGVVLPCPRQIANPCLGYHQQYLYTWVESFKGNSAMTGLGLKIQQSCLKPDEPTIIPPCRFLFSKYFRHQLFKWHPISSLEP